MIGIKFLRSAPLALALFLPLAACAQPSRGEPLPRRAALGAAMSPGQGGVTVNTVVPGLTAESLKIQPGDILVSLDGKPTTAPAQVAPLIRELKAGSTVKAEVLRGGQKLTLEGRVVERPRQKPDGFKVVYDQVQSGPHRIRIIATHPEGPGPFPTLFLIGGIGAYSVDADFATAPYGTTLGPIAKGRFATVRIDKPGQGDSEGPLYQDLRFEVEQDAYLQALRLAKTFPFVDKNRIAIFGHSMGGAFGPLVAAEEPVAGVAVMGTMTKTWVEYTLENTRRQSLLAGAPAAAVDDSIRQLSGLLHYLYNLGMSPEQIIKEKPDYAPMMRQMSPDLKTTSGVGIPFFQKLATINLPEAWAKFEGKTLSLWGENDFISTEFDHQYLADFMNARRPGSAEYVRVPQTDHGFFLTTSQKDSQQKWGRPGSTFNPKTLEALTDWLNRLFPA